MTPLDPSADPRGSQSRWFGPPIVALGALLWATDAVFRADVIKSYSALFIVFFNHWLVLLVTFPVLVWKWRVLAAFRRRDWLALGFISICGSALGMVFFTKAFALTSNYTVPVLIQKLQPLFAIGLAWLVLKERLTKRFPVWAGLALAGAYLVSFGWTNALTSLSGAEVEPVLYAMAAAAVWGASTVAGRFLLAGRDFLFVTAARFTFAAVFIFLLLWSQEDLQPFARAMTADLYPFAMMALVSGLLPLLLYYLGLKWTPASVATLCELAFPLAAIAINWVVLGQPLAPAQIGGAAVLVVAITALTYENARLPLHASRA